MNILTFDFECSKFPASLPWIPKSFPVSLGILINGEQYYEWIINHKESLPTFNLLEVQKYFDEVDLIIAHNLKYDIHWLRACGIKLKPTLKVYDTMLAEYLLNGMSKQYDKLSLEELSDIYLETPKDDKVKAYWDAGYETDEIPLNILLPYMQRDILNTFDIFKLQQPKIEEKEMNKVINLQCNLIPIIATMESTGMLIDIPKCSEREIECENTLKELTQELNYFVVDNLPELSTIPIKWTSGDHLSAILFGGNIVYDGIEKTERILKGGVIKHGTRKAKLSKETQGLNFKPAAGTETKKQGYYQTDKAQMEQLKSKNKQQKRFLEILRQISSAEKMRGTYFKPFQNESVANRFHANFNQCNTVTGRLTCSRLHQIPRDGNAGVKDVFISEY